MDDELIIANEGDVHLDLHGNILDRRLLCWLDVFAVYKLLEILEARVHSSVYERSFYQVR